MLTEKGIDYDLIPVNPIKIDPAFKRLNPLSKIPVLQDETLTLPDSSCIAAYLERRHPRPSLYPEAAADYGRSLFYEEYADTMLVSVLGPVFFQRVVVRKLMNGAGDEAQIQAGLEKAPELFDYLSDEIGAREFLVGDRFSIADIAVASPFVNWGYAGESIDAGRWPELMAYISRIHARPSFTALLAAEKATLGG